MNLSENLTLYDTLEITSDASPQDIREAYLRTKAAYSKDSPALYSIISSEEREEALKKIEEAYLVLSHPDKRREYDRSFDVFHEAESHFSKRLDQLHPDKIVSIDRVPPMENHENADDLLIPPSTDYSESQVLPSRVLPEENLAATATRAVQPKAHLQSSEDRAEKKVPSSRGQSARTLPRKPQPIPLISEVPVHPASYSTSLRASETFGANPIQKEIQIEVEWNGLFIRKIREAYQVSIEELSGTTKLSKGYILAIEEENYAKLPAQVYIRGFVVQIAKALKLPYEKVATAYLSRYHQRK